MRTALFRTDNTEGYTDLQRQRLNREWAAIVAIESLEQPSAEYDARAKQFCDEVSKRPGASWDGRQILND